MNLFEKHSRATMPQVRKDNFLSVLKTLQDAGVDANYAQVRLGDLRPIQHEVIPEKVASIAGKIKTDGIESLSPMIISSDMAILDGHHRQLGGIDALGEDAMVKVLKINAPEAEALAMLKRAAGRISESYSRFIEIMALAHLNGKFYESSLLGRGFSRRAVQRAVAIGLLVTDSHRTLSTIAPWLRESRVMAEFVPALAMAARVVGGAVAKKVGRYVAGQTVKQIVKGQERQLQVVKDDDSDKVTLIDPENPDEGPLSVDRTSVALSDEEENDEKPTVP